MNLLCVISRTDAPLSGVLPPHAVSHRMQLGSFVMTLAYTLPPKHNFGFFRVSGTPSGLSLLKGWLWKNEQVGALLDSFSHSAPDGDYLCADVDGQSVRLRIASSPNETQKLYYHVDGENIILSDKLHWVSAAMRNMGLCPKMDRTSAYSLMTLGHTYEERTFIKDVHKLRGGEILTWDNGKVKLEKPHRINEIAFDDLSEDDFIDALEASFKAAIQAEYKCDLHDRPPVVTLSGGLDSRMNLFYSLMEDQHPEALCFAQSDTQDHRIALDIARENTVPLHFMPLEGTMYPLDIDKNTLLTEGQTFYLGSAHLNRALEQTRDLGFLHTGLIGDGVLGGFCSAPHLVEASFEKKCMSTVFVDKQKEQLIWDAKQYRDEEVFCMRNRVYNHAYSGIWITEPHGIMVSPFMAWSFIKLCMSIPAKYKYRQSIYLKWIERYQPRIFDYEWETIGARPTTDIERNLRKEKIQAAKRKASALLKLDAKNSMNPYEYWWRKQPQLRQGMDEYFHSHLDRVPADDKELMEDLKALYGFGNFIEKSLAVSVLAALKLHFD